MIWSFGLESWGGGVSQISGWCNQYHLSSVKYSLVCIRIIKMTSWRLSAIKVSIRLYVTLKPMASVHLHKTVVIFSSFFNILSFRVQ